jgi:hypothetical protein
MDPLLKSRLLEYAEVSGARIFRVYLIELINGPAKTGTTCALMLANLYCALFPSGPPPQKLTPLANYSWFSLTSVGLPREGEIRIEFEQSGFHARSSNGREIADLIADYVSRFLTPAELGVVSLPGQPEGRKKANSASFIFRLTYLLEAAHVHHRNKIVAQVANSVRSRSEKLEYLSLGPDAGKALEILLGCFALKNHIKELGFEPTGRVLFDKIVELWGLLGRIEHFTFSEMPTRLFIDRVNAAKDGHVRGLTFLGCPFEGESVDLIVEILRGGKVPSLAFRGGLRPDSVHMVTSIRDFTNIRFLEIGGISGLTLSKLCPCLKQLEGLALTNCDLHIGNVLALIQDNGFNSLALLNLSGNIGDGLNDPPSLPPGLVKLHVANVAWRVTSLLNLMLAVFDQTPDSGERFALSLGHATISNGRWEEIEIPLAKMIAENLGVLTWDGNPLSDQLILFLANAPNLTTLSLAECLTPENVPVALELLRKNVSVENLILRGSFRTYEDFFDPERREGVQVIENFPELINLCREAKVIKKLDVRFNLIDEAGCDALAEWAMKSDTLEFLAFDGTRITSLDPIMRFCDVCSIRQAPLLVAFPENDLKRIAIPAGDGLLADIQRIKHQFRAIRKEKARRKPPPPDNALFVPIDVFSATIDDVFEDRLPRQTGSVPNSPPPGSPQSQRPHSLGETPSARSRGSATPNTTGRSSPGRGNAATNTPGGGLRQTPRSARDTPSEKDSPGPGSRRSSQQRRSESVNVHRSTPKASPRREPPERPWIFPIQCAPEIDNSRVVEKLKDQFSMERLLAEVRKTD